MRWLLISSFLSGLIHSRRRREMSGNEWARRFIVSNSILALEEMSEGEWFAPRSVARGKGSSTSGISTQVTLCRVGEGLAVLTAGGNTLLGRIVVVTSRVYDEDAGITRRDQEKPGVR